MCGSTYRHTAWKSLRVLLQLSNSVRMRAACSTQHTESMYECFRSEASSVRMRVHACIVGVSTVCVVCARAHVHMSMDVYACMLKCMCMRVCECACAEAPAGTLHGRVCECSCSSAAVCACMHACAPTPHCMPRKPSRSAHRLCSYRLCVPPLTSKQCSAQRLGTRAK